MYEERTQEKTKQIIQDHHLLIIIMKKIVDKRFDIEDALLEYASLLGMYLIIQIWLLF